MYATATDLLSKIWTTLGFKKLYVMPSKYPSKFNDNIDAGMSKLKWEGSSRIKDIRFQNIIKLKHNTIDL